MAMFDPGGPMAVQAAAWRNSPWRMTLSLWLLLAAFAATFLWHLRHESLGAQERELSLLSFALTDNIDRGLRGIEEGLHAVRAELRDGRLPQAGPQVRRALHTRAELMPLIERLWLVAPDGRTIADSDATPAPDPGSFAPPLVGLGREALAVSRPFVDPPSGRRFVALAVPYDGPDGAAAGWIVAGLPVSALLGAFAATAPAVDVRMDVFRGDGLLLASANAANATPAAEAKDDGFVAGAPPLAMRRLQDGTRRLVDQHVVPRYGLEVVVSRDLGATLAGWHTAVAATVAALLLLLVVMAFAVNRVQLAERRRGEAQQALQAQLSRAGRLEALGTLAGGVAHDFNNVLAGIVGYAELAEDAAVPGSDQAQHLRRVLQAALRGKTLIERILSFSRGGAKASLPFAIEPVVEEVLALLSSTLRPGIVLERDLEAPAARVRGDPAQAFEAIMNLCTNALQAMPRGGRLVVRTERVRVQEQVLSHSRLLAGRYVALSVADQGGGIAPEVMNHLFEPFFTTRGEGSGTGLGLAVVHGVVAEFGGAIDVRSQPGHGARFTIYLPEDAVAEGTVAAPRREPPAGRGRRVLVVDDEPELVGLALEMLEGLGYAPDGCIDALAALDALRSGASYDVVVTDEAMPGLSGTDLARAVRRTGDGVPILLVSGFGGALLAERAAAAGVTRVLAKPLRRADLSRALAEVLG